MLNFDGRQNRNIKILQFPPDYTLKKMMIHATIHMYGYNLMISNQFIQFIVPDDYLGTKLDDITDIKEDNPLIFVIERWNW